MAVRLVVAVTDGDWFDHLRVEPKLPEVNFWSPSATNFRALERDAFRFAHSLNSENSWRIHRV